MTEASQSNLVVEHLSSYFDEIKPTDRLSPQNGRERAQEGELDVSNLLGIERRALEKDSTPAWAIGVLAAEQFRDDLTFSPEIKSAYVAVQEKLEGRSGEAALVLVVYSPGNDDYEMADCYIGLIPEQIIFESEPSYDSIVMPGEIGFHLVRDTDGKTTHLTGAGAENGKLPLNYDIERFNGFNLLDGRIFKRRTNHKTPEGTTAMLLNENEIVPTLLDQCSPAMTAELVIQLATALRSQSPEKVTALLGNIPEIAEHIENRRDMVRAYRDFFASVQKQNEDYLVSGGTIDQLTANFNALRKKYFDELSTLRTKYSTLESSIARLQLMYEQSRTWPYIDFDGRGTIGNLQRDHSDLKDENIEMEMRTAQANEILKVISLLQPDE